MNFLRRLYFEKNPSDYFRLLTRISQIEEDSAWQAFRGFYRTKNQKARHVFIRLYFEELHHADLLKKSITQSSKDFSSAIESGAREDVSAKIVDDSDLLNFMQFQLSGEQAAIKALDSYLETSANLPQIHEVFQTIKRDELGHIESLKQEIQLISKESRPSQAKRINFPKILKKILRPFQAFNELTVSVILLGCYFLFGGLFAAARLLKKRSP